LNVGDSGQEQDEEEAGSQMAQMGADDEEVDCEDGGSLEA